MDINTGISFGSAADIYAVKIQIMATYAVVMHERQFYIFPCVFGKVDSVINISESVYGIIAA